MVSNRAVLGWRAPVKASVSGVSLLQLSPLFTSIFPHFPQKRLILRLGIRKKSIWSSGLHNPRRNSVATGNVLHAGTPPVLWYFRKRTLINCTETSLYWWTVLLVLKIPPIKLLVTANFLHRPPLRNGHVSVAEDMHHSHRLTSATVLLSPWWPLWKDLAVDAIFAIIISTRAV